MKPKVYKIAGVWVWECDHSGRVGDEFWPDAHRDPWSCAQAAAVKHHAQFHAEQDQEAA